MNSRDELLIVALSGRALAQSARRGGWCAHVIDAFADRDTRACASQVHRVTMNAAGLQARDVLAAAGRLSANGKIGLIYGAGMEALPAGLDRLRADFKLLGNPPDVLKLTEHPRSFFSLLDALRIPHPETRFVTPGARPVRARQSEAFGWLVKRAAGAGGRHVRYWDGAPINRRKLYLQRYCAGAAMSALFAADGERARIIGYNTQWAVGRGPRPFAYAGAINRASLASPQRHTVAMYADKLTRALGLVGLNSLDFVLHRGDPSVLEINPRCAATCELYEPDTRDGMVAMHVRACGGDLPEGARPGALVSISSTPRAHAIVYATRPLTIPAGLEWPQWCRDLPQCGARVASGEPICSVFADARSDAALRALTATRRRYVQALLNAPPMAA